MTTYPVITRLADGAETTEAFEFYSPDVRDAVYAARNNPQAQQIEVRRIKNDIEQTMTTWNRDTSGLWIGQGAD